MFAQLSGLIEPTIKKIRVASIKENRMLASLFFPVSLKGQEGNLTKNCFVERMKI